MPDLGFRGEGGVGTRGQARVSPARTVWEELKASMEPQENYFG